MYISSKCCKEDGLIVENKVGIMGRVAGEKSMFPLSFPLWYALSYFPNLVEGAQSIRKTRANPTAHSVAFQPCVNYPFQFFKF